MTTLKCPHCKKTFEVNLGVMLGGISTEKKALAARYNGSTGGRPVKKNPVRIRPWHPEHRNHAKYLAEKKKLLEPPPL